MLFPLADAVVLAVGSAVLLPVLFFCALSFVVFLVALSLVTSGVGGVVELNY